MDTHRARGLRWAANTMKVFGIAFLARLFFAFKSTQFRGFVEAAMILVLGLFFAGIAFVLGWVSAKNVGTLPVPLHSEDAAVAIGSSPPQQKSTGWIVGLLVVGIFVAFTIGKISNRAVGEDGRDQLQNPSPDLATAAAAKLNQGLPRMVTQDVRLDSVAADPGRAIIYNYTFVGLPEMKRMDLGTSERFRALVVASTCSSADKGFLTRGISLRNRYRRPDGNLVAEVTVAPGDCANISSH